MSINDTARGECSDKSALNTDPKSLQSAKIQRDIDKFLSNRKNKIIVIPFGVSYAVHKTYADKARETLK